jgi:hypothetical protein
MSDLSIVTPVKNPPDIRGFIRGNFQLLKQTPLIVIDSGGGKRLGHFATWYFEQCFPFWTARKFGYDKVYTKYVLNLDCDVVVPEGYIKAAIELLDSRADAVSIFYEDVNHCQGALEYGVSIWKTELLKRLYDFSLSIVSNGNILKVGSQAYSDLANGWCECTYMWRKLKTTGGKLETLPYRAKHLRSELNGC